MACCNEITDRMLWEGKGGNGFPYSITFQLGPKAQVNLNDQTKHWRLYQTEKEPVLIRHKEKFIWHVMEKVCCSRSIECLGSIERDEARLYLSK